MISRFVKTNFFTLLLVPYVVGLIGILLPVTRSFFLSLTPYMLLFSFLIVYLEEGRWVIRNILAILLILLFSFGIEYVGVNYGYLFGDYKYGSILGFKYYHVPVIIPLTWAMLSIAARSLINLVTNQYVISALLSAIVITAYDFLLELVAVRFGWWWWANGEIPIFNYICWFIFSFIFQLLFRKIPSITGRSYWMIFVHLLFYWVLLLM
ncbi:MAG: carotenoid biosynthesis protein [Bacteroidia bacterium]|jgi:putative membrane protein|nr:carotenoid biosynthesis protein [Bacteroidia bacterium]MDG2042118.1 carotenoid biosynthesis protein [Bacteroidia bacterium]|tara:strand:+ start:23821 stop:24447 length:627 start_codon:yes stop_codon:yes gene_type:complete